MIGAQRGTGSTSPWAFPPCLRLLIWGTSLTMQGLKYTIRCISVLNTAPFTMHIISNTTGYDNRGTSIHAQPMHSVPHGDTHKPSSILALRHLDFSCTITNGRLKEPRLKIPARLSAMDVDRLSRLAFAPSICGLTMRELRRHNLLQTPTAKPKGM